VTCIRSFFVLSGMMIPVLFSDAAYARTGFFNECELSTGVTVSFPLMLTFVEYGFGPFSAGGGASYCFNAIKEQSLGYDVSAKVYLVPGYLYLKAGYGIAGLETGGSFGSLNRPMYGVEVLGGARILAGEESPYFFFAVEAGATVRTENVVQSEIISNPAMVFPKISLSLGFSFLRDYN
jgi:hypothetical protein